MRWSDGEQTLLTLMAADGFSRHRIAKMLGRTLDSVKSRMDRTGLMRRTSVPRRGWTPEEDAALAAALRAGTPRNRIDALPGRTSRQARARLQTLEMNGGVRRRSATYAAWTPGDIEALADWRSTGIAELARRLGRTENAVKAKMKRLGMRRPRPNAWTTAERDLLRSMIRAGRTYQEIAERTGRTAGAVQMFRFRRKAAANVKARRGQKVGPYDGPGVFQARIDCSAW